MSNDKSNTFSKLLIVRAISSFLKLGDDGKLESFFARVIKTLKKEISAHEKNLSNLKFNHEQEIDDLKDKWEDAKVALNESYMKVEIGQIGNNADQAIFQEVYLNNLDNHEIAVQEIEKEIENAEEAFKKEEEEIKKQILSLEKRIAKIGEEATE